MEKERRSEEETSHHRPCQFLNEAINSFMECLGLHISPSPYYSASSVIYYKFISKEAKENQGVLHILSVYNYIYSHAYACMYNLICLVV